MDNRLLDIGFCSMYFYYNEIIPVKTTRPDMSITRYITKIKEGVHVGRMETTIVPKEIEAEKPQLEGF